MDLRLTTAARGEQGATLVEVIVAVAILGIAFVAILGGMATSVTASDIHRKQADSHALLTRYAEAVKAAPYVACASPADYSNVITAPSGFSIASTRVLFLHAGTFKATCATNKDPQLVTLTAQPSPANGGVETIDVVKRWGQ